MSNKKLFFYELEGRGYTFQNKNWDETKHGFEDDMLNMAWEMWSSGKAVKAQAVLEGFVLLPGTLSEDDALSQAIVVFERNEKMIARENRAHTDEQYLSLKQRMISLTAIKIQNQYKAIVEAQEQKG